MNAFSGLSPQKAEGSNPILQAIAAQEKLVAANGPTISNNNYSDWGYPDWGYPDAGYPDWGYNGPRDGREVGGGGGSSCFVATTCFEGVPHPTVDFLRDYRDTILVRSKIGRGFVACFKEIGPRLGKAVDKVPCVKPVLRTALTHLSLKISDHYVGKLKPLVREGTRPDALPATSESYASLEPV